MKKWKSLAEKNYVGEPGDEVYISKTGKKGQEKYYLINNFTQNQINVAFSSEGKAKEYAKKKHLNIFEESLKKVEESYIKNLFDFPEFSKMNSSIDSKLSKMFKQRDDLVEKIIDESPALEEWMDSGSINNFEQLMDSEDLLIHLLGKEHSLSMQEHQILVLTREIKKLLQGINKVYNK